MGSLQSNVLHGNTEYRKDITVFINKCVTPHWRDNSGCHVPQKYKTTGQ